MIKAIAAFFVLALLGMGGLIVHKERQRRAAPTPRAVDEDVSIATISQQEEVDLARHIASKGLTVVEFTADF